MSIFHTAERVSNMDKSDNIIFQRSIFAYYEAAKLVSGQVLEIGTGEGYGLKIISEKADKFITIDKFDQQINSKEFTNVEFVKMNIPPLTGFANDTFDYVISFQVIEHIEDDLAYLKEIQRVLKPGGKFICTTPNITQSLTRNPWHVREYTFTELETLALKAFSSVEKLGVFGNATINDYNEKNKVSIRKITRFDIFNLQYRLPRQLLQIPYDILNRMNRKKLLDNNYSLASQITVNDYSIAPITNEALDLFYIMQK